jgi:cellulose synthase/poly-beta-1,6-N-acetylglucosamine synthase-like glycosyltransferase
MEEAVRAVGVIIPASNEERLLGAALDAVEGSLHDVCANGLRAHVAVVLDSCRDNSEAVARAWQRRVDQRRTFCTTLMIVDVGNVGRARALGCDVILEQFRADDLAHVWLATTDADSRVPTHWLRTQLRQHQRGADAWAGRVAVTEWPRHRRGSADAWQRAYDAEARPIHGASLGVSAKAYVDAGGFPSLRTGEDRALCNALLVNGAKVHYDASAAVVTSARRHARAPDGFAAALTRFDVPTLAKVNELHVGLT